MESGLVFFLEKDMVVFNRLVVFGVVLSLWSFVWSKALVLFFTVACVWFLFCLFLHFFGKK